jgi:DNA-binding cell septation regulator SpoVG
MNKITEIQIVPVKPNNGLVGFASFLLDEKLYLGSVAIYKRLNEDGYRLTFPTKKIGIRNINIYHPVNKDVMKEIEKNVLKKAEKVFLKEHSYFV